MALKFSLENFCFGKILMNFYSFLIAKILVITTNMPYVSHVPGVRIRISNSNLTILISSFWFISTPAQHFLKVSSKYR